MAYSQQTAHYGLPLPVGSDRSSFLDTNESFTAVDTALYNAVTQNTQTEQEVQDLNAEVAQVQSDITAIGTDIAALQNGLASTNLLVQEHAEDITNLEGSVSTLAADKQNKTDNSLVTTDKTIVGAINELAQATPPTPTVDADDVTYDNTTSGLTATNVQAAIDEVNGKIPSTEYISTDIASGETYSAILARLSSQFDPTKLTAKSFIELNIGSGVDVLHLVGRTNTFGQFSKMSVGSTSSAAETIVIETVSSNNQINTASANSGTAWTTANILSTTVSAAGSIKLIY